ncbi:MAG TPA: sigma-70 family RNA polymerase sigma factor [Phenylobacterium sp.]
MTDGFRNDVIALIPRLRAYAMSLARSDSEADDLVQETLMKAWRARASFEPGTNLQAWLFTILRNNFFSETLVRRRTTQDVDGRHAAQLAASPDQEWRLRYGEMLGALDRLRPHARDALLLVAASGMSYEEAARISGCPVNTMKSRVKRARSSLANMIGFEMYQRPSHVSHAGEAGD